MAEKDVGAVADIDGSGLRVVLVRTRWNPEIIDRLATENIEQALARSEDGDRHNVGGDAAMVAVEMALLARDWS